MPTPADLYRSVLRIRMVEDAIAAEYPKGEMRCPVHLCTGQEAIPAGVCAALRPNDLVFPNYRSHGWYLAKGGDLTAMLAELYGRSSGCSRGYGGSMHLIDLEHGLQGASAIVAGGIPQAVGAALAVKLRGGSQVVVSVLGDGAVEEGVFHEALNFAGLRRLPILFVIEDNDLATNTPKDARRGPSSLYASRLLDGHNVYRVHDAAEDALAYVRRGQPWVLTCETTRWIEHCGPKQERFGPDPVVIAELRARSIAEGTPPDVNAIRAEIEAAFAAAKAAPLPVAA